MNKKYIVRLSSSERKTLRELVSTGKVAAYKRLHSQILLKADIGKKGPGWTDKKISVAFDVATRTIERIRETLCIQGLDAAINRTKGSGKQRKIDGEQEAYLIALSCEAPPEGRAKWSLRLLADKFVEFGHVDSISHEAVRQVLKKTK